MVLSLLQKLNQVWRDRRGQDLVEYALLAAAVVVGMGIFIPQEVAPAVSTIFSKVVSTLNLAPG